MMDRFERLSARLDGLVTVRRILVALVALLLVVVLMQVLPFGSKGMARLADGQGTLDMRFGYSAGSAARLFEALGPGGRSAYLNFLALDLVYMVCSALFQTLTMGRLAQKAGLRGRLAMVNLLPWAKCLFDLAENLAILALLALFPSPIPALVAVASCLTMGKWILYYGCMAILFGLGALGSGKNLKPGLSLGTKGATR